MTNRKLLFLITEDWYFCSHRLPLAMAAKEAGFDVSILTRVKKHGEMIKNAGLELIPISLERRGRNPVSEGGFIRKLVSIYRREKPDIVHHVAMKPVLYGSIAARLAGCNNVINAMAGMGYVFTSSQAKARILRPIVSMAYQLLLNRPGYRLILQNYDDVEFFTKSRLFDPRKIALIRGSGVDTTQFTHRPEPSGRLTVVLASRLLYDKGVREFAEAAQQLHDAGIDARFVLVGASDHENPASITKDQIDRWIKSGSIEWWGYRNDMPAVFEQAHIICLPSYREGLPKVLLEAAACVKPIVATDVPGCREIVRHNKNGLLVPPKNSSALAEALKTLIQNPEMRRHMGVEGRKIVQQEFSQEIVIEQTLSLYQQMLQRKQIVIV